MAVISEEYQRLNNQLHHDNDNYGAAGFRWYLWVQKWSPSEDILDYGCGKGTLAMNLPFPIAEYDPAIPGKNQPPEPHMFIVCTDVLEHVEPECLNDVLADIKRVMMRFGMFIISTKAATKTLPDGRNAHLIVKPAEWWVAKIRGYFDILKLEPEISQDGEVLMLVRCRT